MGGGVVRWGERLVAPGNEASNDDDDDDDDDEQRESLWSPPA